MNPDLPPRRTGVIIALAVVASLALFALILALRSEQSDVLVPALLGIATTTATALGVVIARSGPIDRDKDKADSDSGD